MPSIKSAYLSPCIAHSTEPTTLVEFIRVVVSLLWNDIQEQVTQVAQCAMVYRAYAFKTVLLIGNEDLCLRCELFTRRQLCNEMQFIKTSSTALVFPHCKFLHLFVFRW